MNNDSEKISASEINRYCFCQYSWYYERLYGKKYIREKYKQRNEALNLNKDAFSNFKRGLEFHDNFDIKRRMKNVVNLMLVLIVLSIIIAVALALKICGTF